MSSYVHRFRRLAAITLSLTLVTGIATVIPQSRAVLVNRPYCETRFYGYLPPGEEPFRNTAALNGLWETLSETSYLVTEHYDPRIAALQEASFLTYYIPVPDIDYYFKSFYTIWDGFCRMQYPVFWYDYIQGPLHYSS
ncbi:hypothetical protein [Lawsonella clevelandensis]|uniref:hypothetical protein n=1 Tax=Lawsonella clevelandensis TaxID=1528099 RepID=UPI0011DF4DDD|nr:hypothetical protein [Lawsonella clevelandensis]